MTREYCEKVLRLASEGVARTRRDGAYLHRDQIHKRLKARKSAKLAAVTSGGAIPETADYRVVTEDDHTFVGTVNEDFAIESMAGDVFLLGNTSWRIRYVRGGEVVVGDAGGAPATIPFWLGEAPGRTVELSAEVSSLREEVAARAENIGEAAAWLQKECAASPALAVQAAGYVAAQKAAVGFVHAEAPALRAFLRRFGRHAARGPRALRRPHQPRLGAGHAQALLPHLRL